MAVTDRAAAGHSCIRDAARQEGKPDRRLLETDDSSLRWEKASNAAASIVDHGIDRALRPYFVFYLPVVTLLLVGFGVLLSGLLFSQAAEPWSLRFSSGFAVAAIGTLILGFVYGQRRIKPKSCDSSVYAAAMAGEV